jgi:two-component system OmpR family sensor kinase
LSVLKSRGTSLLKSERKTLLSFLLLYSLFAIVLLLFSAFIYYNLQKDNMLQNQNNRLQEYSYELISKIRYLHNDFVKSQKYPRFVYFNSAIYDSSGKQIFSTLEDDAVNLEDSIYKIGDNIHYVRLLESYYLGAMYVVIEIVDDEEWLGFVKMKVIIYGLIFFLILLFAGYFLLNLLLKPMRESMYLLDRFIKDTTHELNTPVSSILTNIEMMDEARLSEKDAKRIKRIDIASRTISNLYNDLTYIALGNQLQTKDEEINLTELVKERAEYFKVISSVRKLECILQLDAKVMLFVDRHKITRVIDNLISNAIKYNKKGSFIKVALKDGYLCVEDGGIGIESHRIKQMFDRYSRFNDSEGGFGLGLNIVNEIAKEYNLKLKIESELNVGTKVIVTW